MRIISNIILSHMQLFVITANIIATMLLPFDHLGVRPAPANCGSGLASKKPQAAFQSAAVLSSGLWALATGFAGAFTTLSPATASLSADANAGNSFSDAQEASPKHDCFAAPPPQLDFDASRHAALLTHRRAAKISPKNL